jgi:hypothetical protein
MTFEAERQIALKCVVRSYFLSLLYFTFQPLLLLLRSVSIFSYLFRTFSFSVLRSIVYIYLHYFIVRVYLFLHGFVYLPA